MIKKLFKPPGIRVGITATHEGMTSAQKDRVHGFLLAHDVTQARHGDCVGGDAEFHDLALNLRISIVIHPPTNPKLRAWCTGPNVEVLPERPYLVRDHAMVDAIDVLLVAPLTHVEVLHSGTWATYRYARKTKRHTILITPDGKVKEFNKP